MLTHKSASIAGLDVFLQEFNMMARRPSPPSSVVISGPFKFSASHAKTGRIDDTFNLRLEIPLSFPHALPRVVETANRIPKIPEFHINQGDNTLCLGSPLSLHLALQKDPTITGFAIKCLIPYLHAISYKLKHGGPMPFGELAHGREGIIADYLSLFHIETPYQLREVLCRLYTKKRSANKLPCPCGCGLRTGACRYNLKIALFRRLQKRSWYFEQLRDLKLPTSPSAPQKKAKISRWAVNGRAPLL